MIIESANDQRSEGPLVIRGRLLELGYAGKYLGTRNEGMAFGIPKALHDHCRNINSISIGGE